MASNRVSRAQNSNGAMCTSGGTALFRLSSAGASLAALCGEVRFCFSARCDASVTAFADLRLQCQ
jgi:hypothetical protein